MKISTAFVIYILAGLLLKPQLCIASATEGIKLCLEVVVPSLFPFFVCSKMLVKNGFAERMGKSIGPVMRHIFNVPGCGGFAFVTGLLSGCPAGAATVVDMYEKNMCTREEAQRMLCFCNNSGPLFIIGAVAVGMLGVGGLGGILYVSHIVSAVVVGIVVSAFKRTEIVERPCAPVNKTSDVVGEAMSESVALTGYVCGFVIFFAVVTGIVRESGIINAVAQRADCYAPVEGILLGMLEMTNGISCLSKGSISLSVLCATSFVVGFGGLSVILQVYGIVKKHNLSVLMFSAAKLLQGVVSAFVTFLIVSWRNITLPVFAESGQWSVFVSWANSIKLLCVFGIIIFILSIIYRVCNFVRRM